MIGLDLLAFEQEQIDNITDTREEPLDMEQLQKRPGLVGYIAKRWGFALEYRKGESHNGGRYSAG